MHHYICLFFAKNKFSHAKNHCKKPASVEIYFIPFIVNCTSKKCLVTIIFCSNRKLIWTIAGHPSLLRTFGFSAISTYDSCLPLIAGWYALIWDYFQNVRKGRLWDQKMQHGQEVGFWGWKKNQNKCEKSIWPFSC